MTDQEISKNIDYAFKVDSELPNLEFKTASVDLPREIWKSISAFSQQRGGGIIVFGIKQYPLEVVGCKKVEQIQTKMSEYFNTRMSYVLRPEYYVFDYQNKTVVAVIVPECPDEHKPCYFKDLGMPRGAYIREGVSNRQMTENEFRTYIATSKQFEQDLTQAPQAELEELDVEKIEKFLLKKEEEVNRGAKTEVSDQVLQNLNVAKKFENQLEPTLAGFLLFSSSHLDHKQAYERFAIRCVRYSGKTSATDIIDKLDVQATLDIQIDEVYKFILKNIRKIAFIKGTKRQEKYEFPEKALRELIVNAVIHRDYKIVETYTHINIYSDRVEIGNPGSLPPGVTIENIKDAQFSRNPVIASLLKDMKYMEEYGRGIDIVLSKMEEWGLPEPIFRNSVNSFQAVLLGSSYKNLNYRQIRIIEHLLLTDRITIQDGLRIMEGVSRVTINNDLKNLTKLGMIKRKGGSVNTYYTLEI